MTLLLEISMNNKVIVKTNIEGYSVEKGKLIIDKVIELEELIGR